MIDDSMINIFGLKRGASWEWTYHVNGNMKVPDNRLVVPPVTIPLNHATWQVIR